MTQKKVCVPVVAGLPPFVQFCTLHSTPYTQHLKKWEGRQTSDDGGGISEWREANEEEDVDEREEEPEDKGRDADGGRRQPVVVHRLRVCGVGFSMDGLGPSAYRYPAPVDRRCTC